MSDFSFIDEMDVPTGYASYFGLLTVTTTPVKWEGRVKSEITLDEWRVLPDKVEYGSDAPYRDTEVLFHVGCKALGSDWDFERRVLLKSKDWREIVKPSIARVLGKPVTSSNAELLTAINNKQVEVNAVPQSSGKTNADGKAYTTVALVKVFGTATDAQNAYTERYGKREGMTTGATQSNGSTVYPADFLAKYTSDKARTRTISEIKQMHTSGAAPADIAEEYEISEESVKQLVG